MRKLYFNENYFHLIDNPIKAYWLGFILGDGHIRRVNDKSCSLVIELKAADKEHLELFSSAIEYSGNLRKVVRKPDKRTGKIYESYVIELHSVKLAESLVTKGWHEFKDKGSLFIFDSCPDSLLPHLMRGLADADGSIHINKKNQAMFSFIDLHFNVVEWFQNKLTTELLIKKVPIKQPSKAFRFMHEGNKKVIKILDYLYGNSELCLERKGKLYACVKTFI